jgi:hypothetical protein
LFDPPDTQQIQQDVEKLDVLLKEAASFLAQAPQ